MKYLNINGRFLSQDITGVQRVGIETLKKLIIFCNYQYKIRVIVPDKKIINNSVSKELEQLGIEFLEVKSQFFKGYLWEQIILCSYMKKMKETLISFCNTGPVFYKKQYIYVHDAAVYDAPSGFPITFKLIYKTLFQSYRLFGQHIITVSEFSRQRLIAKVGYNSQSITVIQNGINHLQKDKKENYGYLKEKYGIENNFYFTVGSRNKNKNQDLLIDLSKKIPNYDFIIAGGTNKVFSEGNVEENEGPKNLKYIGYISDEDLISLYSNAKGFIFTSKYEGFGIPPFEAMLMNCTVYTTNVGVIRELEVHPFKIYNNNDVDGLIKEINDQNNNSINKSDDEFKKQILMETLTWENAAKKLLETIQK